MKNIKTTKEAYTFLGLPLVLSWFVFWGPLALFKPTAISFVSDVKGPLLAILATTFALMVSSPVNDLLVDEQISMVIIIPVMAGFFWSRCRVGCTQHSTHQHRCICDVSFGHFNDLPGAQGI